VKRCRKKRLKGRLKPKLELRRGSPREDRRAHLLQLFVPRDRPGDALSGINRMKRDAGGERGWKGEREPDALTSQRQKGKDSRRRSECNGGILRRKGG